jgi:hypothetical protein
MPQLDPILIFFQSSVFIFFYLIFYFVGYRNRIFPFFHLPYKFNYYYIGILYTNINLIMMKFYSIYIYILYIIHIYIKILYNIYKSILIFINQFNTSKLNYIIIKNFHYTFFTINSNFNKTFQKYFNLKRYLTYLLNWKNSKRSNYNIFININKTLIKR